MVSLLLSAGADPDATTGDGTTPLMTAVHAYEPRSNFIQRPKVARVLLDHGADVNAQNKNGETALMKALDAYRIGSDEDAVALVIARGANVNLRNKQGETALSMAKKYGYKPYIETLQRAGARP